MSKFDSQIDSNPSYQCLKVESEHLCRRSRKRAQIAWQALLSVFAQCENPASDFFPWYVDWRSKLQCIAQRKSYWRAPSAGLRCAWDEAEVDGDPVPHSTPRSRPPLYYYLVQALGPSTAGRGFSQCDSCVIICMIV